MERGSWACTVSPYLVPYLPVIWGQVITPICVSVSLSVTPMAQDLVLPGLDTLPLCVACSVCRKYFLDHITSHHVAFNVKVQH